MFNETAMHAKATASNRLAKANKGKSLSKSEGKGKSKEGKGKSSEISKGSNCAKRFVQGLQILEN